MRNFNKSKHDSGKDNVSSSDSSKMPLLDLLNNRKPEADRVHAIGLARPVGRFIFALHRRNPYHIGDSDNDDDEYFESFGEEKISAHQYKYRTICFLGRKSSYPGSSSYGGCYVDNCY